MYQKSRLDRFPIRINLLNPVIYFTPIVIVFFWDTIEYFNKFL